MTTKIFHPLQALITSASNNELAKYVEFLKEENKILRSRITGQVHTKPDERSRLIKLGEALGQATEECKRPVDHMAPMRHSGRQRLGSKLVRLAGSVVGRRRSTSRR